jgi:hypothetical protein
VTQPTIAATEADVLIEHFYRRLTSARVASARNALADGSVDEALAQCAEAFERAAAALEHATSIAPADGELAERLAEQREALVCMAARFEQSADLARHVASGHPPRA